MPAFRIPFPGSDRRPASWLVRTLAVGALLLAIAGVVLGTSPSATASAGELTIVLLHVPAAWLSLLLYAAAAACAALILAQPEGGPARLDGTRGWCASSCCWYCTAVRWCCWR